MEAIWNGQVEEVRSCLIEHPEFRNSLDEYGQTPLNLAIKYGHKSIVKLLLRRQVNDPRNGSDFDYLDRETGGNALHHVAMYGHRSIGEWLIQAGVSVDFLDIKNQTPLHTASWYGHESMVEMLLRREVTDLQVGSSSLNHPDIHGWTPLHFAALNGKASVVEVLLRAGSALNSVSADGRTPLHSAAANEHEPTVRILRAVGAYIISDSDLSPTAIQMLQAPISEEEILKIRARIYFDSSLLSRLLFQIKS